MVNSANRLLGGRYQVGALIGRGGMAEVHSGHDTRLGRTVAIKMLRSDLARDPAFLARFRREAQSAAGLNHPAIVAVYDSGEDEEIETSGEKVALPYIVMEYVEGRTLREILTETTVMEPQEAARVTEGVLDALSYSHRMGIVHRDIKPANVMLTPAGAVKVMDFGIARAIADTAATMTQTQSVIGTAQYLSPEQAQGNHVDARSDLYSAGCLLYELLTGRTPFTGDSPVSIAYQHVGQAPQAPSAHLPGLSADLDAVVLHSLVKDRDARYQDASAFRSDLAAARAGRPISAAARGSAGAAALAGGAGGDPTVAMTAMGDTNPTQVVGPPNRTQHNTATLPAIGRDPADVPPKPHKATYALLALAVIAALVLLGLAGKSMFDGNAAPATFAVPTVTNLTQTEAVTKLQTAGFVADITTEKSEVEKGIVIDQTPPAGERHPAKTKVRITVSSGPGKAVVPDVVGFTEDSAKVTITEAGLKVGKVVKVNDPKFDKGKVIETVPSANSSVTAGSAVTLRVASGKVKVPDVVGMSSGDAQQALTDARLTYRTNFDESSKPEGTVLSQTHDGETVSVGTKIVLVVAKVAQPTATTPTAPTTAPTTTATTTTPPAATTAP
ncbi:MAG: eukaryotic-like serine/threonine-protein kinase [Actinomycetota bacterium]|nr:eukaryotic-like serine/threonine-protein kinase [Actinomycetota bacterium]